MRNMWENVVYLSIKHKSMREDVEDEGNEPCISCRRR